MYARTQPRIRFICRPTQRPAGTGRRNKAERPDGNYHCTAELHGRDPSVTEARFWPGKAPLVLPCRVKEKEGGKGKHQCEGQAHVNIPSIAALSQSYTKLLRPCS